MKICYAGRPVIRTTNNLNLHRNIVAQQGARICCLYYLAFKSITTMPERDASALQGYHKQFAVIHLHTSVERGNAE